MKPLAVKIKWFVRILFALTFMAGCAGEHVIQSYWSTTGNSLPSYSGKDKNTGISWTVANDSRYLYLTFDTNNRQVERTVMFRGVTIYLDPTGKNKKDIYLKYPYRAERSRFIPRNSGNSFRGNNPLGNFKSPTIAYWEKGNDGMVINSAMEHTQFKYDIKLDSLGFMEYKVQIPISRFTSAVFSNINKLAVGIVAKRPEQGSGFRSGFRARGGFSGRERGEGGERGGYGDRDSGRRRPMGMDNRSGFQPVNVDIWFLTKLASSSS